MPESPSKGSLVKSFAAGSLSGTCSTLLFQPLDLIKTRLQTLNSPSGTGMVRIVGTVVYNENVFALWKGLVPSLIRTVPGIGIYFCSLHTISHALQLHEPKPYQLLVLGASARTLSGVVTLPVTLIKTRYESGIFTYRSVFEAVVRIYQFEGIRGLYSGLSATLLRDVPFSALYLMFYTQSKRTVRDSGLFIESQGPMVHFSCGVFAGCFASVVTHPADVIKTHMQLYPDKYVSLLSVVRHVIEIRGIQGMLKGLAPRMLKRTLMAAMAWTVYEQVLKSVGLKQNL